MLKSLISLLLITFTLSSVWLNTSYSKHSDHTQFRFLQVLDETLSRYEQINESSSSANVSADSCVETLIPENDDFFPKCDTLSIGTQTTKKSTREKGTKYKDATIRNKFTQTVNVITYNTTSTQIMPHPCTCLESSKKDNIKKSGIKRIELKTMTLYGIGI